MMHLHTLLISHDKTSEVGPTRHRQSITGPVRIVNRPYTFSFQNRGQENRENMGSVFGKESVKEPPHEVLLAHRNGKTPYEMRRYGVRYAAWTPYEGGDNSSPFRSLARYIGVFGTPENEGKEAIAMVRPISTSTSIAYCFVCYACAHVATILQTAPVVMEKGEPESIAMVREHNQKDRKLFSERLVLTPLTH